MKGSIVIGDHAFPIVSIRLRNGAFTITGCHDGPVGPVDVDHYELFDEQGNLVARVDRAFRWDALPGSRSLVTVEMRVERAAADGPTRYVL